MGSRLASLGGQFVSNFGRKKLKEFAAKEKLEIVPAPNPELAYMKAWGNPTAKSPAYTFLA